MLVDGNVRGGIDIYETDKPEAPPQHIALPDETSFTPLDALVFDDNSMMVLTSARVLGDGVDADPRSNVTANLIVRNESGQFELADRVSLGMFDARQSLTLLDNGVVTVSSGYSFLGGDQEITIIRKDASTLSTQTFVSNVNGEVIGLPNMNLVYNDEGFQFLPLDQVPQGDLLRTSPPVVDTYFSQYDANRDGIVTALDALIIINALNSLGEGEPVSNTKYDVSGDGRITALDALMVINELNRVDAAWSSQPDDNDDEDELLGIQSEPLLF